MSTIKHVIKEFNWPDLDTQPLLQGSDNKAVGMIFNIQNSEKVCHWKKQHPIDLEFVLNSYKSGNRHHTNSYKSTATDATN
jgi:hypothetical protein